jgi:hypothetical protein
MAPSNENGVNGSANGVHTNGFPTNEYSIPLNDQYAFTPRKLKVVTIGAGFSGLMMAHKFQHRFPEMQGFIEHTILERHSELGGTWLVNTYPGVQCDVPSHIYVCVALLQRKLSGVTVAGISIRSQSRLVSILFQWR